MFSHRKKIYADDLILIIDNFKNSTTSIINKLDDDRIVNQGLFLMSTALFEDAIRELMRVVLLAFPEKLQITSTKISKKQICEIADKGYQIIIDSELYLIFHNGVKEQIEFLFSVLCESNNNKYPSEIIEVIKKISDIFLYRNSLVHNGGRASVALNEKAEIYKVDEENIIEFDKELIEKFNHDFLYLFNYLSEVITSKYKFYSNSRLDILKCLWYDCFSSGIMTFDNFWEFDIERDLITGIKYSAYEGVLSSSEIVLLSIWRHQYDDSLKTKEFLICSVNYENICRIYKGLHEVGFCLMFQESKCKKGK